MKLTAALARVLGSDGAQPSAAPAPAQSAVHERWQQLDANLDCLEERLRELHNRRMGFLDDKTRHEESAAEPQRLRDAIEAEEVRIAEVEAQGGAADYATLDDLHAQCAAAEVPAAAARRALSLDQKRELQAQAAIRGLGDEQNATTNARADCGLDCLNADLDALQAEADAARAAYIDHHVRLFSYALAIDMYVGDRPGIARRFAHRNTLLRLPLPEGLIDRTRHDEIDAAIEAGAVAALRRYKLHY